MFFYWNAPCALPVKLKEFQFEEKNEMNNQKIIIPVVGCGKAVKTFIQNTNEINVRYVWITTKEQALGLEIPFYIELYGHDKYYDVIDVLRSRIMPLSRIARRHFSTENKE